MGLYKSAQVPYVPVLGNCLLHPVLVIEVEVMRFQTEYLLS